MAIFDELKAIGKILQEAGKIEQYQQILEAQRELLEMQKKIQNLEKENAELKEKLKIKENLIYENNAYWISNEGKKDGPFCTRCWDVDKNLVRMHPGSNSAYYYCPNCKAPSVKIKPELDSFESYHRNYRNFNNFE